VRNAYPGGFDAFGYGGESVSFEHAQSVQPFRCIEQRNWHSARIRERPRGQIDPRKSGV
jgi:hypothetical protein